MTSPSSQEHSASSSFHSRPCTITNGVVAIRASVSCCRRRKWADIHAGGGGDDYAMFQRVVATEAGSQRAASPGGGGASAAQTRYPAQPAQPTVPNPSQPTQPAYAARQPNANGQVVVPPSTSSRQMMDFDPDISARNTRASSSSPLFPSVKSQHCLCVATGIPAGFMHGGAAQPMGQRPDARERAVTGDPGLVNHLVVPVVARVHHEGGEGAVAASCGGHVGLEKRA